MLARFDGVFEWVVWGLAGAAVLLLLFGPRVVAYDSSKAAAPPASAKGAALFKANCGSCHTLAAAGTSGVVGPKLDGLKLTPDAVIAQMRSGGGAMPSFRGQFSPAEEKALGSFVAQASSSG